ncbi:amidase [Phytoactinopolyspora limicola]|uniref:amidase n=1 Tax=Phytoactinopolyspora limicola TaxID=2715536 RepID=UPI00140D61D6|nr:amidase [Phytoactinopolyspora limicola]
MSNQQSDHRPAPSADPLDLTIEHLRPLLDHGEISPVALTEAAIQRIDAGNEELFAFADVYRDTALDRARAAEDRLATGAPVSPLDGVPVAVKSLIDVAGRRCEAGSRVLEGHTAVRDAAVVNALERAGAIIVGATTMDEFALTTVGPARSPIDPRRTAGGSSGGSGAAVRAGMCFAALGTDTGGSIRVPATCCGVVGLKPTYGLLPLEGVVPLAWSLDHVGPLARTVGDVRVMFDVLLAGAAGGTAAAPSAGTGLAGRTIAVPDDEYLAVLAPSIAEQFAATLQALRDAGAELRTVELPAQDGVKAVHWPVLSGEMAAYHRRRFGQAEGRYAPPLRDGLTAGDTVSKEEYVAAQRQRPAIRAHLDGILAGVDAIALPTMAIEPPLVGQDTVDLAGQPEDATAAMVRLTSLANHTGHPAVSVPPGTTSAERMFGVQLIGRYYDEHHLLDVAGAVEALR